MIYNYRPQIPTIFGAGAVARLGEEIKTIGSKRPLCVYGSGTKAAGIAGKAEESLSKAGLDYCSFDKSTPDPTMELIDEIAAAARAERADCIIGIGGGSNMDAAKAASVMLGLEGPARDHLTIPPRFFKAHLPVVLLPTTSGSGSEASNACVITHEQTGVKIPALTESALAIVDPELTLTLSPTATAETGLDAFSHAAEAMTGLDWNPRVEMLALAAIKKIVHSLPAACMDGSNLEARTEMACASNWAGFTTVDAPPHVGHGIADVFTQAYPLTHGLTCAWATPEVLELTATAVPDKVRLIGEAMGLSFEASDTQEMIGAKTAEELRGLMKTVGIKSPAELGLDRESVVKNAGAMLPLCMKCPVKITPESARALVERVYDNY